jgi:hypothetical protein
VTAALDRRSDHRGWETQVLSVSKNTSAEEFLRDYGNELKERKAGLWGMLRRRSLSDAIEEPSLPVELRLFLLATTRAEPGGHAIFEPGELLEALPQVSRSTGVLSTFSHRHVSNSLKELIAVGLFAESSEFTPSGVTCLVLPESVYRMSTKYGPQPCPVHGHNLSWGHGCWFDPNTTEEALKALGKGTRNRPDIGTHGSGNRADGD